MDLEELRAFLAVADSGSFLTAAKTLRLSRATLRRRIDQLEARAGVLLVDRTRVGVMLTEAGSVLAARGRLMVQEAGGLIEDVDLAVHFGDRSPAGPWVSREILRLRIWLVASREYLARRGTPKTVEDLQQHDLLSWECPGHDGRVWSTLRGGTIQVAPFMITRHIHLIRQYTLAGLGIALVPDAMLPDPGIPDGTLVPVLPDVVGREIGVRLMVPAVLSEIPRIKAMLELLKPFLGNLGF